MRILAPPGVFRPRSDTWLLADHLRRDPLLHEGRVLDLCAGSGALAVVARLGGAASATAVDVSRRAVFAARLNGLLNGVRVRARRGDLLSAVPVGTLTLRLVDADSGQGVRELTPPGGAQDLLPGEYAYTLTSESLGELEGRRLRFVATARASVGGARTTKRSPEFTAR
jgi:SAM-dependent methyltransferase